MIQIMLCFVVMCTILGVVNSNVMGIDFGSDSMKVAIIQPGTPLEIVTNFQSKRKTPTCISFNREERLFGADAYALMARKPEVTFTKFNKLLGRTVDHPFVSELKSQYFPYQLFTNETTGFLAFKHESTSYTPEELMAMMLQHAKDMTFNFGGKQIVDCVLTIPSSFTQHERTALLSAAEIAKLNVLSLVEENTAAALHYGIDRVHEKPNNVLFYNMGASSVQVSIVQYSSYNVKDGADNKTIGQFEVLGKGWDAALGGFHFDLKLADLLADRFNVVWNKKKGGEGKNLKDFYRPMTRLRLEATKLKEVLSANNELPVKAEQLHAEVDLITKVTREEFEAAITELLSRVTIPIDKALAMANMTMSDVHTVELLGGGVRVPSVKKLLDEYFKQSKLELGQHLNADEAMALGAAFKAANLSTSFKVRRVGMLDTTTHSVEVKLTELLPGVPREPVVTEASASAAASTSGGGGIAGFLGSMFKGNKEGSEAAAPAVTAEESQLAGATAETVTGSGAVEEVSAQAAEQLWAKHTTLYGTHAHVPAKAKSIAFQHDRDIKCTLAYSSTEHLEAGTAPLLVSYNITGLTAHAKEAAAKGLKMPKVHLHFTLDVNGLTTLSYAESTVELPEEVEATPIVTPASAASAAEVASDGEEEESSADGTTKDAKSTPAKKTKKEQQEQAKKLKDAKEKLSKAQESKNKLARRRLLVVENLHEVTPPHWNTTGTVRSAIGRLRRMAEADQHRQAKEAALNDLETYLYMAKNKVVDEEDNLKLVSTEEERQAIVDIANAAEEWLYDEGRNQEVETYHAKKHEISRAFDSIWIRFREMRDRPEAVAKAREELQNVFDRVSQWGEDMSHIKAVEKTNVLEEVQIVQDWITEKMAAQSLKSPFEHPVFELDDLKKQLNSVYVLLQPLVNRPIPKPRVKVEPKAKKGSKTSKAKEGEDEPVTVKVPVMDDEEVVAASPASDAETDAAPPGDSSSPSSSSAIEDEEEMSEGTGAGSEL